MNNRIKTISKKLQKWALEEEQKNPGFNPLDNDLYYVMFQLEIADTILTAINNMPATIKQTVDKLHES